MKTDLKNPDKIPVEHLPFHDIFDISEIQRLQDLFSEANSVASIIIAPDNKIVTKPSNFCSFCNDTIDQKRNYPGRCCLFDSTSGYPDPHGAIIDSWLGEGFLEAYACIFVGGVHIATWIIGPVRTDEFNELEIAQHASLIGITEHAFEDAVQKIPITSYGRFEKILKMLFAFINELSEKAYSNLQLRKQIRERIQDQASLQESEEKYRLIFDNNPQPMWIYDLETLRFLEVNHAALTHYGYTQEEFLGMTIKDIRPDHDVKPFLDSLNSDAENHFRCGERRHLKKNGEQLIVEITSQPIQYKGKKARHVLVHDITERKKAEAAVRNNKIRLQALIKTIPDLVWLKDPDGVYLTCNTIFERFFGAKETDIVGKTDYDFVNKELADFFRANDLKAIAAGKPSSNEEWVTFADDGHRALLDVIKTPMFDQEGGLIGVLGIGRDITEKRKADEELMQVNSELTNLMDNLDKAVFSLDIVHNKMLRVSVAHESLFGYPPSEFFKNPRLWYELIVPEDRQAIDAGYSVLRAGKNLVHEFRIIHPSGEIKWIETKINPVLSSKGELIRLDGIASDITDRKHTEQELIAAKEKAEESDRLKSAFLANMSHEVRTPLNAIIGFSELLPETGFNEEQKNDFIRQITTNGNHLLTIISDIMDISKLESGELKIHWKDVNVNAAISRMKEQFSANIAAKKLSFKLNLPTNNDETFIAADPDRLAQIFNNLIDNSMKFTEQGGIEIGYEDKGRVVEFYIKDTGIGIPVEFQEVIFERFRQVELSNSRKYGGNGLGLAISKKLIELMNGEIRLESEPGKGATFYFTLPKLKIM